MMFVVVFVFGPSFRRLIFIKDIDDGDHYTGYRDD